VDYRSNKAWQRCDDLAAAVYQATTAFPREERFGLTKQMRDASVWAAANIAEGYGRRTVRDLLHFLYQARGSLNEVEYLVHLSHGLGYLDDNERAHLAVQQGEAARALHGLIRYWEGESSSGRIEKSKSTAPRPWPLAPSPCIEESA
jgi:four helix bundle protein